jgi:hypothetical protein
MESKTKRNASGITKCNNINAKPIRKRKQPPERQDVSLNEATISLALEGLSPYVRVVKPSRSSLTYERME